MNFDALRAAAERAVQEWTHARRTLKAERGYFHATRESWQTAVVAQEVIQAEAAAVQEQAHAQISGVVTRCLSAVFGRRAYRFTVRFLKRRGRTWARLVFARGDLEFDPADGTGGGVIDVAAFALRLSCLLCKRPKRRRLLVCDEPFKHLSVEYRPAVRDLLEQLADELDMQFLIVTHSDDFTLGKVVRIGKVNSGDAYAEIPLRPGLLLRVPRKTPRRTRG